MLKSPFPLFCGALLIAVKLSPGSCLGNSTVICHRTRDRRCEPSRVEFFSSSSNRELTKLIMLTVPVEGDNQTTIGDDSKFAVCSPDKEDYESSYMINQVNLLSHVFCRQMGYSTYIARHPANVPKLSEGVELALWPTALCNGTEQRLQDCYWPELRVAHCHQLLEVQCGPCSKFYSHVDDGVITSPGFPNSFPFTVQCDWLIHTKLGDGIELRFTAFNLPTTQLPMSQMGSSSCTTSNAYLEITPNDDDIALGRGGGIARLEEKVLANSNRYCVFKSPDKSIRIMSKAVLLHFSSGTHNALFWNFRSSRYRPIGIKVYFRAIAADVKTETDLIRNYLIIGLSVMTGFVIVVSIVVVLWMRTRYNARCIRPNHLNGYPNRRKADKWKRRALCLDTTTPNAPKYRDQPNNYEEIVIRPPVPPRFNRDVRTESVAIRSSSQRSCASYESSPRASRNYMQIVCSSAGHCAYIPVEEIESEEVYNEARRTASVKSGKTLDSQKTQSTFVPSESSV